MEGCVTDPCCLVIVPLRSIVEEQVIYNDFDITAFLILFLSLLESSSSFSLKSLDLALVIAIGISNFRLLLFHKFTIFVINYQVAKTNQ